MAPNAHLDHLRRQLELAADDLPPDIGLRFRAMFGGLGAYARERMFASLSGVGLGLKLAPADQELLLREEGAKRLQYEAGGPVSKQYVVVPPALVAEPGLLAPWVRRSVEHVSTLPVPKGKRARSL